MFLLSNIIFFISRSSICFLNCFFPFSVLFFQDFSIPSYIYNNFEYIYFMCISLSGCLFIDTTNYFGISFNFQHFFVCFISFIVSLSSSSAVTAWMVEKSLCDNGVFTWVSESCSSMETCFHFISFGILHIKHSINLNLLPAYS